MLLNAYQGEVFLLFVLLGISGISSLARVDSNWSQHRRPNMTVAQNQRGQAGYRPAGVGYQQPLVHNRTQTYNNHQQQQPPQWQQHNNRTQYNQPGFRPAMPAAAPPNAYKPQQPSYGQGVFNQTRPTWQQPSAPNQPQYPGHLNQSRPSWQQPNQPQYPSYAQGSFNQSRPSWPQPAVPNYPQALPQAPNYPQPSTLNTSRPAWPQPSAPQVPNYPALPNNSNNKPAVPSWTPPANQTHLYPQLPTQNLPQPAAPAGNSGIPLAPLQPAPPSPQGPHNWHSGGQAVLSYGPGHYPQPAGNSNKNPSSQQGSSNPYANMFN